MAILRKNNHEKYTVVDNEIVRDDRLTLKSFGLLIKLLALPDNWEFSEKGLETIFKDGLTSIRSGLKDLEKLGYLKRTRARDEKGRMTNVEWIIFEKPLVPPKSHFPIMDSRSLENSTQYNTNISNTKQPNTNINNKGAILSEVAPLSLLFFSLYYDSFGEEHPHIKINQIARAESEIQDFLNECGIDEEFLEDIILKYFQTNFPRGTDYNINHFANREIMVHRAQECGLITIA